MEIQFKNISKKYGKKYALKNFSASLGEGVFGLLGANGAGKTTLINILVGVLKSNGGNIFLDGKEIGGMGNEFLSRIGYMPQYPLFYNDFRVAEFLDYIGVVKGMDKKLCRQRAEELLQVCNLSDVREKKIGELSGGMRQRMGIIQAMLNDPSILILDEPTAGLDVHERISFRNLISRFSGGRTVLLATHIVSDVECIANEVLILRDGMLIRQDTPTALEREIAGKVWLVEEQQSALDRYSAFEISNMQRKDDRLVLRIVAEQAPSENALNTEPNLEDVFLYYFGNGGECL